MLDRDVGWNQPCMSSLNSNAEIEPPMYPTAE
jgi:hypothetical protein